MANELRVRQNFLGGLIEDNPLTSGATTLTSAALSAMVAIGSTQHLPITLDPDGVGGDPEIVYVTAHTAAATTATILRAQEGTTARAHNRDMNWTHGPTVRDLEEAASSVGMAKVETVETTTSTSYTDLATPGPAVTVNVPASGRVLIHLAAGIANSSVNNVAQVAVALSGSNTVAASDTTGLRSEVPTASRTQPAMTVIPLTGLTPGPTTFTVKYAVSAGTGEFRLRRIAVIPL